MKIEKLACCLAKPMNAIRDLAEKVNEVIAAHNDHLENHPSGGGGGGESTGAGVAILKVNCTTEDMASFTVTSFDKTYSELKSIYDADGLLWCRLTLDIFGNIAMAECTLEAIDMVNNYMMFKPLGILAEQGIIVTLYSDNTCKVEID